MSAIVHLVQRRLSGVGVENACGNPSAYTEGTMTADKVTCRSCRRTRRHTYVEAQQLTAEPSPASRKDEP